MGKTKFYKISALALTLVLVVGTTVFAGTLPGGRGSKDKIQFTKYNKGNFNNKNKWDSLVTAGTITQAEETAAIALFTPSKSETPKTHVNSVKTKLDILVTTGTITQAQETTVLNLMTPTKGRKDNKGRIKTGLDGLVTTGTITSAQETSIITALTPINPMKTKLDTLVTAGTLTSDQEAAMINALKPTKGVKTSNRHLK
jgi:hypothetical protein